MHPVEHKFVELLAFTTAMISARYPFPTPNNRAGAPPLPRGIRQIVRVVLDQPHHETLLHATSAYQVQRISADLWYIVFSIDLCCTTGVYWKYVRYYDLRTGTVMNEVSITSRLV